MSYDFVVCVINTRGRGDKKVFGRAPGPTRFLLVPEDAEVQQPHHGRPRSEWVEAVMADGTTGKDPMSDNPTGNVLVFIHGYNNSQEAVLWRHRMLKETLRAAGYRGTVVSFDWPSAEMPLLYMRDRRYAKATAERLTDDCISLFSTRQARGCDLNVHLLGHSTGAYVIRHAFTDADEVTEIKNRPWKVSQIALIGADVSSCSLADDDPRFVSVYRHCSRLTNYQSGHDGVLRVSNAKRIGLRARAGRVGLPDNAPPKAVNVDCSPYFAGIDPDSRIPKETYYGNFAHSWHIGDPLFAQDLCHTLHGQLDRYSIPTRREEDDRLYLHDPG